MPLSWLERGLLLLAGLLLVTACAGGGGSGASAGSAPGPSSFEPTRVTLSQYTASGALQGFSVHTLKPDGAPTHISHYNPAGALRNYTTYDYDAQSRQTRIGFYNAAGGLLRYETYGYEGSARVPHYHGFYSVNGTLVRFEAYDYDDEGQLSYHGFYDAAANLTRYAFYNYTAFSDRNGTTRIDFYNATNNLTGIEIRSYDVAGQHNHTAFYDATGALTRYTVSTYADGMLRYVATYTATGALMEYVSYGDGTMVPSRADLSVPAVDPMMAVMSVPDGNRAQPPADPPARAPAQDMNAPPARTSPPETLPDRDDDGLADDVDNCPARANRANQDDADMDGIGDACEAEAVLDFRAFADGQTAMNLSWVNPSRANLTALNLSYQRRDGMGAPIVVDLTRQVRLTAGAVVRYRVADLLNGTAYTFTVGGFDFRHGRISQPLPLVSINRTTPGRITPEDRDGDGVPNAADNCPLVVNADDQENDNDEDGIGDACEARAVSGLNAMLTNNATVVVLSWTNPAGSDLRAMNISYHPTNDPNDRTTIDITARVPLGDTGRVVRYQIRDLAANTAYTFRVGGIDFRHGRNNQPLPTVSVNAQTPLDQDGDDVADGADNCPLVVNAQDDDDGDNIGDACEARAVSGLNAMLTNNAKAIVLSWTNPAGSDLRAMNISYHPTNDPNNRTEIDTTAAVALDANEMIRYQVRDLVASTAYTFRVGGIDFRHGRRNQTLPPASVTTTTLPDMDGDGVTDAQDNCPTVPNAGGQGNDGDMDGIGDACEVEGVEDLRVLVGGETTVNLGWINPADSALLMLNIAYGPSDDPSNRSTVNITANVDLAAGAVVISRALRVVPDVWYAFTVRGIDARDGVRNQTLPPVSVRFRTRTSRDGDGIADGEDNCIADFNPDQADSNGDTYGDVCGPDRDGDGVREIQTARQMNAVRNNLGAQYELLTDIDLSSYTNWDPIRIFSGVLEGNGYTIANLSIARSGKVGLFGEAHGATIRNITLRVNNINASSSTRQQWVGGLIGEVPSSASSVSIRDVAVIVEGSISVDGSGVRARVGGIIGRGYSTIRTSYVVVRGEISGTTSSAGWATVGGLSGWLRGGAINNSYALVLSGGAIKANRGSFLKVAGLVGVTASTVSNSYAVINGTISSSSMNSNDVRGLTDTLGVSVTVTRSYFAAPGSVAGSGTKRTLQQLKCPTAAGGTCASATTYSNWNSTIWDFGNNQTLPDLRSKRRPAYINDLLP